MAHHIFQKGCPALAALDIPSTLAWYREKLGFTVGLDQADYGIVHREGVEIHFWLCEDRKIAEATSAYIRVADIDAAHEAMQYASEGGRITGPTDRPYGLVEFEVWDPNGNLLRFGQMRAPPAVA